MSQGPVIFYDGVCGLCNRFVAFVLARDTKALYRFAALQGATAESIRANLTGDSMQSVILVAEGRAYTHSEAALRILTGLGGPWRWVAAVGWAVPVWLRDAVYRGIARNRYLWFGRFDACPLPRPGWENRFLDGRP